ncbi:unnamed protein product [Amoebophrya sp. A25]|nr:unnamed protein product [Amoebophrya sp. A25]|eukprot:GSA25T00008615001.1
MPRFSVMRVAALCAFYQHNKILVLAVDDTDEDGSSAAGGAAKGGEGQQTPAQRVAAARQKWIDTNIKAIEPLAAEPTPAAANVQALADGLVTLGEMVTALSDKVDNLGSHKRKWLQEAAKAKIGSMYNGAKNKLKSVGTGMFTRRGTTNSNSGGSSFLEQDVVGEDSYQNQDQQEQQQEQPVYRLRGSKHVVVKAAESEASP